MDSVVGNPIFNESLFKGMVERHGIDQKKSPEGEKGKDKTKSLDRGHDKRKENPNPPSSSSSKSSKMSHSEKKVTHKDKDTDRPLCPAYGAYSSSKYDPRVNPGFVLLG